MFWGRTVDECTSQFCLAAFGLNSSTSNVDKQPSVKSCIKRPNTEWSGKTCPASQGLPNEKKSFKKSQNNFKTPTCSSLNTISNLFSRTKTLKNEKQSKKTSIRKCSQNEIVNNRQKIYPHIHENLTRSEFSSHQPFNDKVNFSQNLDVKQNRASHSSILKFPNQVKKVNKEEYTQTQRVSHLSDSYQNSTPKYVHTYPYDPKNNYERTAVQGFQNANFTRCISPNGRIFQNVHMLSPNHQRIVYHELNQNSYHPQIQINQGPNIRYIESQHYTPIQSIQKLVIDSNQRFPQGQFTTIRQQNQTYQQSKSITEQSKDLHPTTFYEQQQKIQQISVLNSVNSLLESRNQQKEDTLYEVIENNEPQFKPDFQNSSRISGENKVSRFDLSCEELLIASQGSEKVGKMNENMRMFQLIRRKQEQQVLFTQRRQMQQPSICLRMIENQMRRNTCQISRTSSEGIQSIYKSSNPTENPRENFSSPKNLASPRQVTQQTVFKIQNENNLAIKKVSYNLEIEPSFSQENAHQKSLIHLLEDDKENDFNQQDTFRKQNQNLGNNLVQQNLFKELTNQHSERQFHTSNRKIGIDPKKVKSLIQRKVTINSVLQESSSFGRNVNNQRSSNQLITKHVLDDNYLQGILSNNNVDRDESTVIGRYTFSSTLQKLL